MVKRSLVLSSLLVFVLAHQAPKTFGQAVYGSIVGTVFDSSGGAVPNAKVTVTDMDKNVGYTTSTNQSGNYSETHLMVGRYRVRIEVPGFRTFVDENVIVNVDAAARVDATLVVGAVTQQVTVTAGAPLLKTERADVATTLSEKVIEDLPVFDRNFTALEFLAPGTQKLTWQHAASEDPQGGIQIMVNGQHFSGTSFQLDGTDNRDPILGIIVVNPQLDSVREMKFTTQNYDPEFGQAMAGVITAQTKSGTNELHGSAFMFRRNDLTEARDPFAQSVPIAGTNRFIPQTLWNQFGGSLGGPIKKDKTFIFGDYQGTRRKNGGSALVRVPTAAERAGDLSDLGVDIFDPLDVNGNPLSPAQRSQFMGNNGTTPNVIPTARLSLQTLSLLNTYIPLPTVPGATGATPNYNASGTEIFNDNGFDVRADHYRSEKLRLFGRYSFHQFHRSGPGAFGLIAGGTSLGNINFSGTSDVRNQSISSGFDYSLRPTWLADFRFGFFRYRVLVNPKGLGTTPAKDAGIPGLNLDKSFTSGMPAFYINGPNDDQSSGPDIFDFGYALNVNNCNCPLNQQEQQFQWVNNWTNIRGNHTIKFGADIRHAQQLRVPSDFHRAGELAFNPERTEGANGGGLGLATFLLGDVSTFARYVSKSFDAAERQNRWFFYGQDTWRVTPRLTVNYGLRWEIYFPEYVNSAGNGGFVRLDTGEVWTAGTQGVGLNFNVKNSFTNFAPRIGVAFQATHKTVLRLGYGRSFDIGTFGSVFGHVVTQNLPVLASQQDVPANTYDSVFNLAQGPQMLLDPSAILAFQTQQGNVGATGKPLLPDGVSGLVRPSKMRMPTVDAWNVTLQHELTPSMAVEVGYVGNKGTHIFTDGVSPDANQPTINGFAQGLSYNQRQPFFAKYGWTQQMFYYGDDGDNHYDSLQARFEKRFSGGYYILAHYTWASARNYDDDYFYDTRSVNYGTPDWQRAHTIVVTHIWELPFGRGKKYLGNASRAFNYLVGGWQLDGAWTWMSGLPFTPSYTDCGSDVDTGPCRPNLLGDASLSNPNQNAWFKPASGELLTNGAISGPWQRPQLGTFGNVGRNTFRGPKFFNTDMAIFKNFLITERLKGQFRAESFNTWNHVNLGLPGDVGCGATVDCSDAGKIFSIASGASMRQWQFGLRFDF